jgi:hypothetical protein
VLIWFAVLSVVLVAVVFKSPGVDYRTVIVGALLPVARGAHRRAEGAALGGGRGRGARHRDAGHAAPSAVASSAARHPDRDDGAPGARRVVHRTAAFWWPFAGTGRSPRARSPSGSTSACRWCWRWSAWRSGCGHGGCSASTIPTRRPVLLRWAASTSPCEAGAGQSRTNAGGPGLDLDGGIDRSASDVSVSIESTMTNSVVHVSGVTVQRT